MRKFFSVVLVGMAFSGFAQQGMPEHLQGRISYPLINEHPWAGVIDQKHGALPYDSSLQYRVMVDLYDRVKNPDQVYSPVSETARTLNLIAAYGVPADQIQMAVIVHGGAIDAFLGPEAYKERFGQENPNLPLIRKLYDLGVRFYVCSQSLGFRNLPNEDMCEQAEIALSAKTSMILLDQRGYSYLDVNGD